MAPDQTSSITPDMTVTIVCREFRSTKARCDPFSHLQLSQIPAGANMLLMVLNAYQSTRPRYRNLGVRTPPRNSYKRCREHVTHNVIYLQTSHSQSTDMAASPSCVRGVTSIHSLDSLNVQKEKKKQTKVVL